LVHAKTEGNPFFVIQFLHVLADGLPDGERSRRPDVRLTRLPRDHNREGRAEHPVERLAARILEHQRNPTGSRSSVAASSHWRSSESRRRFLSYRHRTRNGASSWCFGSSSASSHGQNIPWRSSSMTRLADGSFSVQGDGVQLQQVVLNLILNAVWTETPFLMIALRANRSTSLIATLRSKCSFRGGAFFM
jgi:hypothetical protein